MFAIKTRVQHPTRAILVGFLLALCVGTGLLMLPIATADGGKLGLLPALFTATSALCVTGLSDVETATYWSPFGHVVILALIQIGGFGVMSFATILGYGVTRRVSLSTRITSATESHGSLNNVKGLLAGVLKTALVIEGAVALALTIRLITLGYGLGEALWLGIFHSISAFNNAGFSLFPDSMTSFVGDWLFCLPIMVGIVLGGLGFPVLRQLYHDYRLPRVWTMNTRLVLLGSAGLLILSTIFLTATEWSNPATLGPLPFDEKLLAGMFQAVQTRTAGFNSIDIGSMHSISLLGMDLLMFIGGGPAGTAGGVKITTVLVLIFVAWTEIRNEDAVNILGRRLPRNVQRQAITVSMLANGVVILATFLLLIFTPFTLDETLFEAVSAFATVGMSTGITAQLDAASQCVLIVLMVVGRLGPITVATALAGRNRKRSFSLPTERPIIG